VKRRLLAARRDSREDAAEQGGVVKRWLVVLVAVFVTAVGIPGACAKPSPSWDPSCDPARTATRTVDGTLGSVTLHGTPRRVVALEFSFVDDLVAVGVDPVGIADDNDPNEIIAPVRAKAAGYTSVGLRSSPSLETIASLRPDLIIADSTRDATIYSQLQAIAPTIALDSLKEDYQANLHAAVLVGQAVNKCGAMLYRIKQDRVIIRTLSAEVLKATGGKGESRRAMFAVVTPTLWNVHSNLAYTPSLLQAIGIPAANVLARTPSTVGNPYIPMAEEDVVASNPDIMFIAEEPSTGTLYDQWSHDGLFSTIRAVQTHNLYLVNTSLWSRARGILAGEMICQQAVHLLYDRYVSIALPNLRHT
jgi:ferric citrate transport system substrate-binding protein